ncbi:hypothetical protein HOP50_06g44440 [Chloropicon primus]|uniref:EamA domain-containing protein n=2 Tax=Chloropicon primus TaxID=1764295 RepID=A0A5B8MRK8_9CHLO|nr:hypothetical protein A3770_06p44200 [Chloropicon primus]UPR01123.1 hypothetical protein HOP50_06g44440 [Chloropicon primus]|eukprot:QDZ21902.1 hypothetical protein A3770_06p44200 [Chloropicon primus]
MSERRTKGGFSPPPSSTTTSNEGAGDESEDPVTLARSAEVDGANQGRSAWCKLNQVKGFSCVTCAAFIWVVSSYWVRDLEGQGMTPLLLTSLANSMFSVLLPVCLLKDWITSKRQKGEEEENVLLSPSRREGDEDWGQSNNNGRLEGEEGKYEKRKNAFLVALCVWPLWFTCLYIYNWSFVLTSVMSNTILSIGGTSLFTYFLELRVMKAKFSWTKVAAIGFCVLGTVLWCFGNYRGSGPEEDSRNALLGDFLCLISSGLYAVVSIIIGKYLPKSGEAEMAFFWGCTGLINLCVMMPLNVILCLAGQNNMQDLPAKLYGMVMLKGLMDNLLSNYMWAYAVLFIGPTSANVGMSIETPMVVIIDLITRNATYLSNRRAVALNVVGAITIMTGFFGLSLSR